MKLNFKFHYKKSSEEDGSGESSDNDDGGDDLEKKVSQVGIQNLAETKKEMIKEIKANPKKTEKAKANAKAEVESKEKTSQAVKRGQKTRLNKMKTKYKDQDEEDRIIAMQFLKVECLKCL